MLRRLCFSRILNILTLLTFCLVLAPVKLCSYKLYHHCHKISRRNDRAAASNQIGRKRKKTCMAYSKNTKEKLEGILYNGQKELS